MNSLGGIEHSTTKEESAYFIGVRETSEKLARKLGLSDERVRNLTEFLSGYATGSENSIDLKELDLEIINISDSYQRMREYGENYVSIVQMLGKERGKTFTKHVTDGLVEIIIEESGKKAEVPAKETQETRETNALGLQIMGGINYLKIDPLESYSPN